MLACSGLLTRSALNIFNRPTGFDRTNTLTATSIFPGPGYTTIAAASSLATLLDRLRNAPGVASATLTTHLPMGDWGSGNTRDFSIPGYVPAQGEDMSVVTDFDGPDFFRTMGIHLQQGRDFTASDNDAASQRRGHQRVHGATATGPKGNALGSSIVVDRIQRQIVGIVHDYAYYSPDNTVSRIRFSFLPLLQGYSGLRLRNHRHPRARRCGSAVASRSRNVVTGFDPSRRSRTFAPSKTLPVSNMMSRIPAELLGVYAISSVLSP